MCDLQPAFMCAYANPGPELGRTVHDHTKLSRACQEEGTIYTAAV